MHKPFFWEYSPAMHGFSLDYNLYTVCILHIVILVYRNSEIAFSITEFRVYLYKISRIFKEIVKDSFFKAIFEILNLFILSVRFIGLHSSNNSKRVHKQTQCSASLSWRLKTDSWYLWRPGCTKSKHRSFGWKRYAFYTSLLQSGCVRGITL